MTRGEVVWVNLPYPSDRKTSEQAGRRPAVVIQDDQSYGSCPTVVVVPLTSKLRAMRFPGTFLVKSTKQNGLSTDSVALAFQMAAVDRRRLAGVLGTLGEADLECLGAEVGSLCGIAP